ncbi:hypothetical protein CEXT_116271 [Caerostris extrusa]|uniref:Uncharacterized protein n=1 Tax=Caerostris extrusa TaxID=172846 RepID=A0AAV4SKZ8_CAEEX|nr:hypothetical protein CEXT_116271 [Caerostris extrusa]
MGLGSGRYQVTLVFLMRELPSSDLLPNEASLGDRSPGLLRDSSFEYKKCRKNSLNIRRHVWQALFFKAFSRMILNKKQMKSSPLCLQNSFSVRYDHQRGLGGIVRHE